MRDALIFARDQLLKSADMKVAGGNVLFFEGYVQPMRLGVLRRTDVKALGGR